MPLGVRSNHFQISLVVALSGAVTGACSAADPTTLQPGAADSAEPGRDDPATGACATLGATPLRRLSHREYQNTVRDLFPGYDVTVADFVPDKRLGAFDNQVEAQAPTPVLVEQYNARALAIVSQVWDQMERTGSRDAVLPCTDADPTCARRIVTTFGRKAFRRPLQDAEVERWTGFFERTRAASGFDVAARLTVQGFLQAPQFLYRIEHGEGTGPRVKLTPHEIATRLSYALWASMPDERLASAADAGALGTRDEIAGEARRMLRDPKAARAVLDFHSQWLDLVKPDLPPKDAATYPEWSADLGRAAMEESERFIRRTILEGDGTLSSLLLGTDAEVTPALAALYGASAGGDGFTSVQLDPTQRAGVLTRAAFLMTHAQPSRPSPVRRGVAVLERFLCAPPAPAPANIQLPEDVDPRTARTNRELFALHSTAPRCNGCHQSIDPVGFGFEGYDAIGRFRTTDNGYPVDATGAFSTRDGSVSFTGAVELSQRLAASDVVRECYTKQQLRYALGREETDADACTLEVMNLARANHDEDVREVLVALVASDAFLYRVEGEE